VPDGSDDYEARLGRARSDAELLVRRFQTLSETDWERRRVVVLDLLQRLVQMTGRIERRELPALPELGSFALSDAFAVVCGDVLVALGDRPEPDMLAELLDELHQARIETR
jgi:hypothetical protein